MRSHTLLAQKDTTQNTPTIDERESSDTAVTTSTVQSTGTVVNDNEENPQSDSTNTGELPSESTDETETTTPKKKKETTVQTADDTITPESTTVVQAKGQAQQFFSQLDVNNPSWDMFIVIFFVVASLLYGWSLGRDRIIVILVSIYMALTVVHAVPDFVLNVTLNGQYAFKLTTFISIFVALFFLISRSALVRTIGVNANDGKWYQTIIFSILHVGLLISITMSFLPPDVIHKFAPQTQAVFTNEWAAFAWIAAPIIAMIMFGSKQGEE